MHRGSKSLLTDEVYISLLGLMKRVSSGEIKSGGSRDRAVLTLIPEKRFLHHDDDPEHV